ncbi:MAG: hypothetical protein C0613_00645 [Desulfobulbaceae bacterium]|nr:MAG: hypothetical protein C0613_00645 [Desulfobulbaceae bacterium]
MMAEVGDKEFSFWAERALLVDDDSSFLQLMGRYLHSFGLEADQAANGKEAVALLQQQEYGVVITDMMMPEMDGMELLHYISDHHPATDVLVVSGYSKVYSFTDVITAGATDFVVKPFERDELKAKLKRIYRERMLIADLHNEIRAHKLEFLRRQEEQDKLQTITSTANDAIIMMDGEGLITFWNQAAEQIFGYKGDEVMGGDIYDLIVPSRYHDMLRNGFELFRKSGHGHAWGTNIELGCLRKNGEEFPVELSLAGVLVKGEWHAVGLLKDITKRKIVEAELRRAKAVAEAASKAKSDFMNTISHELRTPMNGIIGFAALLKGSELSEKQRNYLSLLQKSADRLMALIAQLLNFSSVAASRRDLQSTDFNFAEVVCPILKHFQAQARAKGLSLTSDMADDLPAMLHGDHVVLQQIISNILENAVKYTERGGISFKARQRPGRQPGQVELEVAIKDSGCAIAPDKQKVIFDAFTQAEEYMTRKYQGAGLGLTVAARLVELLGGKIWLESAPGTGSTFFFTVQFYLADQQQADV